jgi:hypothetical protein
MYKLLKCMNLFFIFIKRTTNNSNNKSLKMLYKYQYYLTKQEKNINPEWGKFIEAMVSLYPVV